MSRGRRAECQKIFRIARHPALEVPYTRQLVATCHDGLLDPVVMAGVLQGPVSKDVTFQLTTDQVLNFIPDISLGPIRRVWELEVQPATSPEQ